MQRCKFGGKLRVYYEKNKKEQRKAKVKGSKGDKTSTKRGDEVIREGKKERIGNSRRKKV